MKTNKIVKARMSESQRNKVETELSMYGLEGFENTKLLSVKEAIIRLKELIKNKNICYNSES